jgi:hypothetical protein
VARVSIRWRIWSRTCRATSMPLPAGCRRPSLVELAGEDRAGVTASHGDHDVRLAYRVAGEQGRLAAHDVDADFGHGLHCGRVDLIGWLGAGGPDVDAVASQMLQPAGRHLGAAGVVDADEQDARFGHVAVPISVPSCWSASTRAR